jgi:hypothetical protein
MSTVARSWEGHGNVRCARRLDSPRVFKQIAASLSAALVLTGSVRVLAEGMGGAALEPRPVVHTEPIELADVGLGGVSQGRVKAPASDTKRLRLDGLVLLHLADGIGAGGQLRFGAFGLRASAGYQPLLFVVDRRVDDQDVGEIEFMSSGQLNLDVVLLSQSEIGASLGYRYNTLLGHGAALAFQSMFELWQQDFSFSVPLMYYPQGTNQVLDELGLSSEYHVNFPFGGGIQYGVGVAWVL